MDRSNLPKNWIVCSSKSYPDKVYYFNKVTNKRYWEMPVADTENEPSQTKRNSKKRKKETDSEEQRPKTPEMNQETERPVLQAKRRISLVPQKVNNETPLMREIREKMLQKQEKLSKGLKLNTSSKNNAASNQSTIKASASKISPAKEPEIGKKNAKVSETEIPEEATDEQQTKVPENVKEPLIKSRGRFSMPAKILPRKPGRRQSTSGSESSSIEKAAPLKSSTSTSEQKLTPQMRMLLEKIEQKKALKTGSPRKSLASSAQSPSSSSTTSSSSTSGSTSASSSSTSSSSTSAVTSTPKSQTSGKKRQLAEPLETEKIQETQNTVTTRRRSRLSTSSVASAASNVSNLSALPEEKGPEEIQPKKKSSVSPSPSRKYRRTIFIDSVHTEKAEADTTFKNTSSFSPTNYPKNIAKKRLEDLRRSLNSEKKAKESLPVQKSMCLDAEDINYLNEPGDESQGVIIDPGPEPTIYTNAENRAKIVRDRVLNYQSCTANVNKTLRQKDLEAEVTENQPILARLKDFNNDPYYEEMEWEPIEDEKIMSEVQAVRTQLYTKLTNPTNVIQENILELPPEPVRNKQKSLYIVVDTNVFLSNLQAIEEARDTVFKSFGRPFIVIPWTVLQELDFIKDDKSATRSEALKSKARRAVRFLHHHFSTKHPRILGQTPEDVAKNKEIFAIDCPDDEILQSCLQIRNAKRPVVLLSYDKNLCNKAMIYDIVTVGRDDPFEKIDYLNIDDMGNDSSNRLSFNQANAENEKSILNEELLVVEDIFEETKAVLLSFVSPVVATEMQNLYGDSWERFTIVKPPWSTKDVLKCAIKHWMAAVSDSFTKRAESIFKELLEIITNPPAGGRRLKDVSFFLERCSDLMLTLKQEKYPNLLDKTAAAMNALRQKSHEETRKICEKKINDEIGYEHNIPRQDCRAEIALNYFNKVYAFTRDFCGIAGEALNMPNAFFFDKSDKRLNQHFVTNYQPALAANLNHLLQILSLAMEDVNGLQPDHRAIIVLTEALLSFFPEEFKEPYIELTPLDVYCLIKNKVDVMKRGLSQLQDLSQHFCRMASFRCR